MKITVDYEMSKFKKTFSKTEFAIKKPNSLSRNGNKFISFEKLGRLSTVTKWQRKGKTGKLKEKNISKKKRRTLLRKSFYLEKNRSISNDISIFLKVNSYFFRMSKQFYLHCSNKSAFNHHTNNYSTINSKNNTWFESCLSHKNNVFSKANENQIDYEKNEREITTDSVDSIHSICNSETEICRLINCGGNNYDNNCYDRYGNNNINNIHNVNNSCVCFSRLKDSEFVFCNCKLSCNENVNKCELSKCNQLCDIKWVKSPENIPVNSNVCSENVDTSNFVRRTTKRVKRTTKSTTLSNPLRNSYSSCESSCSQKNECFGSCNKLKYYNRTFDTRTRKLSINPLLVFLLSLFLSGFHSNNVLVTSSEFPDRECCDSAPPPPPQYHTTTSTTPVPPYHHHRVNTKPTVPAAMYPTSVQPTGKFSF